MDALIGIWALLFLVVILNGFAAGMTAVLHVWRRGQTRRSRALTAAATTGFVPIIVAAPAVLMQASSGAVSVLGLIIGFAVLCALTMAVSLPGAVLIARKLDGPGDAYRTFE